MNRYCFNHTTYHQRGAVLVISLIILLIMTLIGVSGMQSTALEEKMSANNLERQMALFAAEAALFEGETLIGTSAGGGGVNSLAALAVYDNNGGDGLYNSSQNGAFSDIWTLVDWDGTNAGNPNKAIIYAGADAGNYRTPPKYVIEHYAVALANLDTTNQGNYNGPGTNPRMIYMFRVTARGTNLAGTGQVILQTIFGRRIP